MLVAAAALLLGLTGTTLRTGWIAPFDWLLPGTAAIMLMRLLVWHSKGVYRWRFVPWVWALVTLPAGAFCLLAGIGRPWMAVALLAAGLGLAALASGWALRLVSPMRWLALAALLGVAALAPLLAAAWQGVDRPAVVKPIIGVMAGVPVQGVPLGAVQGVAAPEAIGLRSPLWHGLEARFRPRALDTLDAASLEELTALLLVQPRRLLPVELVALDGWVRGGGRLVVLADPLLHWPDPRPLGHPARAPLTSLLDPLLTHWGLRLEPAEAGDSPERRRLASGGMVQLSGASRFVAERSGGCALHDGGLIARCRVGQGTALLVADADWANDPLWTMNPDDPADRAAWTSDAVDLLDGWLRGTPPRLMASGTWLADRDALLRALRVSLALLCGLGLPGWLVGAYPTQSMANSETEKDQKRNKSTTKWDLR
ncbi:MAG: hypothetical protein BGP16_13790 [Sphingobium sp. 66-54]|nr:MAG: hypothetical protein BGP16_13790 [Sphingobium sp. 66-54]